MNKCFVMSIDLRNVESMRMSRLSNRVIRLQKQIRGIAEQWMGIWTGGNWRTRFQHPIDIMKTKTREKWNISVIQQCFQMRFRFFSNWTNRNMKNSERSASHHSEGTLRAYRHVHLPYIGHSYKYHAKVLIVQWLITRLQALLRKNI